MTESVSVMSMAGHNVLNVVQIWIVQVLRENAGKFLRTNVRIEGRLVCELVASVAQFLHQLELLITHDMQSLIDVADLRDGVRQADPFGRALEREPLLATIHDTLRLVHRKVFDVVDKKRRTHNVSSTPIFAFKDREDVPELSAGAELVLPLAA